MDFSRDLNPCNINTGISHPANANYLKKQVKVLYVAKVWWFRLKVSAECYEQRSTIWLLQLCEGHSLNLFLIWEGPTVSQGETHMHWHASICINMHACPDRLLKQSTEKLRLQQTRSVCEFTLNYSFIYINVVYFYISVQSLLCNGEPFKAFKSLCCTNAKMYRLLWLFSWSCVQTYSDRCFE